MNLINKFNNSVKELIINNEYDLFVFKNYKIDELNNFLDELDDDIKKIKMKKFNKYKEMYNYYQNFVLEVLMDLKSGKRLAIPYELFINMLNYIDLFKDKKVILITNPFNIISDIEINKEGIKEIYKNNSDLNVSDDEEIEYIYKYYDILPVKINNDVLFNKIYRDLTIELDNLNLFPNVDTTIDKVCEFLEIEDIYKVNGKIINFSNELKNIEVKYNLLNYKDAFLDLNENEILYFIISDLDFIIDETIFYLLKNNIIVKNVFIKTQTKRTESKYKKRVNELIKEYWKSDFKVYDAYDLYSNDPKNLIKISQEDIILEILEQSEKARNKEPFHDIFFIASTGAGKSLLYQIPSIILHEENLVTIVVSPLRALMEDQFRSLHKKRIRHVTYINSDISYIERMQRIEEIKNGKYSLVFVSPEFLQRIYNIHSLIGENRKIGLFVVDEAHCVATWGKDFRADYGYLGNYIYRYRKLNNDFPILALTATAVFGGINDTVSEISKDLRLSKNTSIYMTDIKRNNIEIDINKIGNYQGSYRYFKKEKTIEKIRYCIENDIKLLVYSPFKSISYEIYNLLDDDIKEKVAVYNGDIVGEEGKRIIAKFKSGDIKCVIATKAFGMGIDISDIEMVYHYAIPGNLSDYVQEIGRVARDKKLTGRAICDFNENDFSFWKILKTLSRLRSWQLRQILQKINHKYKQNKKNTILMSLDEFKFIDVNSDSYNSNSKIKQALFFIEKDLFEKYKFPIIRVYPGEEKACFYAFIEKEDLKKTEFKNKYSKYTKEIEENISGKIVEFNLKEYYEEKVFDEKYGKIKFDFFNEKLDDVIKISPRFLLKIKLNNSYNDSFNKFCYYLDIVKNIYNHIDHSFTREQLEHLIKQYYKNKLEEDTIEKILYLMTMLFTSERTEAVSYELFYKKINAFKNNQNEEKDTIIYVKKQQIVDIFVKTYKDLFTNTFNKQREYKAYLKPDFLSVTDATKIRMNLAYIIELFDIGNYIINGGNLDNIKIKVNLPDKLNTKKYVNKVLNKCFEKDNREFLTIKRMIEKCNNSNEFWNYIENYFIGYIE